jgi:hypothetical protein
MSFGSEEPIGPQPFQQESARLVRLVARIGEEGLRLAESPESPWSLTQACLGIGGVLATRGAFSEATSRLERGSPSASRRNSISCPRRQPPSSLTLTRN